MGYHITVRRGEGELLITEEEFAHAVGQHSDLRYDPAVGKAEIYDAGELVATLKLQNGEIWTKVAEPVVIRRMVSLASILNAKAYGDEDEWYSEDGEAHFPPGTLEAETKKIEKIRYRRVIVNIVKLTLLLAVITKIVLKVINE
ncbi:hypothetical protein ACR2R6_00880 [Methylocaldum gracile subsp. desertum]|uniref:hypothetical protein n=1 Tax=Methylocaldum sp. GT1BW TaxID=3438964 RepID=UPI003D9FE3BC